MKKVESLTDKQIAKFPLYITKWKGIGLCTRPADRAMAERGIRYAYLAAKLQPPKKIVWTTSPLVSGLVRSLLFDEKFMEKIGKNVRQSVEQSVWQSVEQSVEQSVGQSVEQSVWQSVWQSVRQSVWQSVWQSVEQSVGQSVRQSVYESGYGQHDANWIGFYDYFRKECNLIDETEPLMGLTLITNAAGWYLPHEHICWISERHNILHLNAQGQLHKDGGIALAYPDGWGIYALNGVMLEPWMIETSISDLDAKKVITIPNVDQRREVIRRMGVDLLTQRLGAKTLNKVGTYELLSVSLGEGYEDCRMLKMVNPSIGVHHVEGVHPDCDTVEKAINWRAGDLKKSWVPQALS